MRDNEGEKGKEASGTMRERKEGAAERKKDDKLVGLHAWQLPLG